MKVYALPVAGGALGPSSVKSENDAGTALAAFRRWREDTLAFIQKRTPVEIERACVHPTAGRMTMNDVITLSRPTTTTTSIN